jgi:hypothetical protein
MSITVYSEEQIRDAVLGFFRNQFPDKDLSTESYLGLVARAVAQSLLQIQSAVQRADWDGTPAYQQDADGTLRTRTSREALEQWAFVFGLPSGKPGIYGSKGALAATGGQGTPTGTLGTIFPAGSLLSDNTGQITVQLNAAFTVTSPVSAPASFTAVTQGAASNQPVGTVLTWQTPPPGGNPTVTLTAELAGGQDTESDIDLLNRLLFRIQNPSKGGTAADYKVWAENATDSTGAPINIARAYVFPLRGGLGTVDVMPLLAGTGLSRDPGDPTVPTTIAGKVLTYLQTVRPVTAVVRVIRPFVPAAKALQIRVRCTPSSSKYAFDWDDTGTGATLLAGSTSSSVVVLSAVISNLTTAFLSGGNPRIQLASSAPGATTTPYQRRVINLQANTPVAGQTTLTLDSALPITPIVLSDILYAGGPIVDTVAGNIQAFINNLGPSRQSGYANEFDPWEYKVSIARLADVVLESRDTDGTRMVSNIPNIAAIAANAVQIAVGPGPFTTNDYEPKDVAGVCELAFMRAGGIVITGK